MIYIVCDKRTIQKIIILLISSHMWFLDATRPFDKRDLLHFTSWTFFSVRCSGHKLIVLQMELDSFTCQIVTPDFEVINRAINHMCAGIKKSHIYDDECE
jgi:hypothetical protein